jgi:hypothetical protein
VAEISHATAADDNAVVYDPDRSHRLLLATQNWAHHGGWWFQTDLDKTAQKRRGGGYATPTDAPAYASAVCPLTRIEVSGLIRHARSSAWRNHAMSRKGHFTAEFTDLGFGRTNDTLCRSNIALMQTDPDDGGWDRDEADPTAGG